MRCGKLRTVGAWWVALTVALLMIAVFSASAIAAWRGRLTGYASARIVRVRLESHAFSHVPDPNHIDDAALTAAA